MQEMCLGEEWGTQGELGKKREVEKKIKQEAVRINVWLLIFSLLSP